MKITETPAGVRFTVQAQPRASSTEVVGPYGDAVKIRIAAPPVEGAANAELVRFLAKQFRVSVSTVQIVSGESSKKKIVEIAGISADQARNILGGDR